MRKIIALLCGLAMFASISVACNSNEIGKTSSSNNSSPFAPPEEDSSNIGSESSSSESEKDSGKEDPPKDNEKEQYYMVTFDSGGGTFVAEQRVQKGEKVIKPENPTKASTETTDFEFVGWYAEETLWDFDKNTVEKDIILRAKWREKKYSVDLPI
ncbi:MAG: hypothetical protein E7349_07525 [Clostridiales bacterium]|nr:hypothetical protein [Clostridiales bacterium]